MVLYDEHSCQAEETRKIRLLYASTQRPGDLTKDLRLNRQPAW
jgi:hypothetical protein